MARKKKKLSRKEKMQQRRAVIEEVRKERGWEPPSFGFKTGTGGSELVDDMLPLFPLAEDTQATPTMINDLVMSVLDSGDLAEEPEFEEVLVNPFRATETLAEVGQELGLNPETLEQLPSEEQAARQAEIMELTTRRLFTDELRQDTTAALERLRQRLKQSGDEHKVARAAALQSFLNESSYDDLLPMIGLVQAIVRRSLAAGFELMEASMGVADESDVDADDSTLTIRQKLVQSNVSKKAEAVLKKVPGLSGFLQKQADRTWEEGMAALFQGDLYLELFTQEEIRGGVEVFREVVGDVETGEAASTPIVLSQDKARTIAERLGEYVTELITPERLERLRDRVEILMADQAYSKWLPFLFLLDEALAEEDVLENDLRLLVTAFTGELRAISSHLTEAEEEHEPITDAE